jgi:FMN-dependent NADH-azoreductase
MRTLLYVNSCVTRGVESRTNRLARAYIKKRLDDESIKVETLLLEELNMMPLTQKGLIEREEAINRGDFSSASFNLAKSFASADEVVIAAPYWDMSFPSLLKLFIEQICVNRLTFGYSETGRPYGIVNVKNVVYVTTAGGSIGNANFGFDYIKGVFSSLFGIDDITFLSAEGVDIYGNDPELILLSAIDEAVEMAAERTRNI